jgi:lipopolysaccharide/colanic/teichoic acid biosynthesis glycosyltransferase
VGFGGGLVPMFSSRRNNLDGVLKRTFDVAVSSAVLSVLAVPLVALAAAIKVDSRGPVFYRGVRVGRGGKPFRLFKFRSMVPDGGKGPSTTTENDPRITRVGHVLRRYKLDELPQFINVLVGDMSIVGPRPQVQWVVDGFSTEERGVLEVRPGITDWASIRFHNEGEIVAASGIADPDEAYFKLIHPEKMRLQLEYVHKRSLFVDLKIILQTAMTLVRTRTSAPETPLAASQAANGAHSSHSAEEARA